MGSRETRELVCIACPTGCRITVTVGTVRATMRGAGCARGKEYAESELTNPERTFTGTVRVAGGVRPVVPVRSDRPIERERLLDVARAAGRAVAQAPVRVGDVVVNGIPGSGALVATDDVGAGSVGA